MIGCINVSRHLYKIEGKSIFNMIGCIMIHISCSVLRHFRILKYGVYCSPILLIKLYDRHWYTPVIVRHRSANSYRWNLFCCMSIKISV